MSCFEDKLEWIAGYRCELLATSEAGQHAMSHLQMATDALHMTLLNLEIPSHPQSLNELDRQIAQARHLLMDAALHLSRARVYIPQIRTFTADVIILSDTDLRLEQARLRRLTTQLLWYNHRFLPTRRRPQLLLPEDEIQLARMVQTLTRQAKIARSLKARSSVLMSVLACLGACFLGWGVLALGLAASALFVRVLQRYRTKPKTFELSSS